MNNLNPQAKDSNANGGTHEISRERSYSEVPGLRHETKDVLQQLQANINHLEDLGGRLGFTITELRSLIRR